MLTTVCCLAVRLGLGLWVGIRFSVWLVDVDVLFYVACHNVDDAPQRRIWMGLALDYNAI